MYAEICHHRQELKSQNTGLVKTKQVSFARIQYVDEMAYDYIYRHMLHMSWKEVLIKRLSQRHVTSTRTYLCIHSFTMEKLPSPIFLPISYVTARVGGPPINSSITYIDNTILYIYIYIAIWISIQISY